MQSNQLKTLNEITGVNFHFVSADNNNFGVKYYEHKCPNNDEYFKIAGDLNQYENINYTCLEHSDGTSSIVVLQNNLDKKRLENILWGRVDDLEQTKPIGKIHGNDVFLDLIRTQTKQCAGIVSHSNRAVAVVIVNGKRLPFYVSSGISGKEQEYGIASGKWYPLQGISDGGWLNKMPEMNESPYPEMNEICKMLEQKFPASIYKQRALNGELPVADNTALLESANNDFIEGTPYNERNPYQYYRNHIIYLPAIIDAWRSKPVNFLEITHGELQISELNTLEKVRKTNIMANSLLDGDTIWFKPVNHQLRSHTGAETVEGIQKQLWQLAVSNIYVSSNKHIGIGVPVESLENYFDTQTKAQVFAHANSKVKKMTPDTPKKENALSYLYDKLSSYLNK